MEESAATSPMVEGAEANEEAKRRGKGGEAAEAEVDMEWKKEVGLKRRDLSGEIEEEEEDAAAVEDAANNF